MKVTIQPNDISQNIINNTKEYFDSRTYGINDGDELHRMRTQIEHELCEEYRFSVKKDRHGCTKSITFESEAAYTYFLLRWS